MYGCLDVNFADAGHGNGPSLHTYKYIQTYTHPYTPFAISKKVCDQIVNRRVWMYGCHFCPCRPRENAHSYIHTWTDAVSERADFFMYVYPQTYIMTSIHKYRGISKNSTPKKKSFFFSGLPMPAEEIANIHGNTYIKTFDCNNFSADSV